jgi:hypothetical protein
MYDAYARKGTAAHSQLVEVSARPSSKIAFLGTGHIKSRVNFVSPHRALGIPVRVQL